MSLINTVPEPCGWIWPARPPAAGPTPPASLPAPGMFLAGCVMVYQAHEAVSIPIVGMGGVTSRAGDVMELMLAGATGSRRWARRAWRSRLTCQDHHRESARQVMRSGTAWNALDRGDRSGKKWVKM
ncbi:MAG: hypothetical protein ACLU9S_05795 [Oscillospiraceae bacterium]